MKEHLLSSVKDHLLNFVAMLSKTFAALSVLLVVPHVIAHGVVTSPAPRTTGAASVAACGSAVVKKLGSGAYDFFPLVRVDLLIS